MMSVIYLVFSLFVFLVKSQSQSITDLSSPIEFVTFLTANTPTTSVIMKSAATVYMGVGDQITFKQIYDDILRTFVIPTTNADMVFLLNFKEELLVNDPAGSYANFIKVDVKFPVQNIIVNSKNPSQWIVESTSHEIYVSQDYGKNFKAVPNSYKLSECKFTFGEIIVCKSDSKNLLYTKDFFGSVNYAQFDKTVSRIISFGMSGEYLLVAVRYVSNELDLYSSPDGLTYLNTDFITPDGIAVIEASYTILEGNYGITVAVHDGKSDFAQLYYSSSSGQYFTRALNNIHRSKISGFVDYERLNYVDGIIIGNVVDNYQDLLKGVNSRSLLKSKISFHDGRRWEYLKPPTDSIEGVKFLCDTKQGVSDKCSLHLHSVTYNHNSGSVYSDSSAPGLVMGCGNVGDYLTDFTESDFYISEDFGLNWRVALKGPHIYETLDSGGIIVAASYGLTSTLSYSTNFGQSWKELGLSRSMRISLLVSDEKSSVSSVVAAGKDENGKYLAISIDLSNIFRKKCESNDFESITASSSEGNTCVFGQTQVFSRRKSAVECRVGREYSDPKKSNVPCDCSDSDYECDTNFIDKNNDYKCTLMDGKFPVIPPGSCLSGNSDYLASSGYRKIPGDQCKDKDGVAKKDEKVTAKCPDSNPDSHLISPKITSKVIDDIVDKIFYLKDSSTVIMRHVNGKLERSVDDGGIWNVISLSSYETGKDVQVVNVRQHDHVSNRVFLITNKNELWYSSDFAQSFFKIETNDPPTTITPDWIDFHPDEQDWLLLTGYNSKSSNNVVYFSEDNGKKWNKVTDYVHRCLFSQDLNFKLVAKRAIYCSEYEPKMGVQDSWGGKTNSASGSTLKLYYYSNDNANKRNLIKDRLVEYYVFDKFLAVAVDDLFQMVLYTSINGMDFNKVVFPPGYDIITSKFTLLQSPTGRVFLNIADNSNKGIERGILFTSNSGGQYFSVSLTNVNMNSKGYVDFERIKATLGVIIANTVEDSRTVKSVISYDDGDSWSAIKGPTELCKTESISENNCYLHFHSRSELTQEKALYSVETAPGMILAVGNLGPHLNSYETSDTWISNDSGKTWSRIQNGPRMYIFADHGNILLTFDDLKPSNQFSYSLDFGKTWRSKTFFQSDVKPISLNTDSLFSGLEILLFGTILSDGPDNKKFLTAKIDLNETVISRCSSSDFEMVYVPSENCFLGTKTKFRKRKQDSLCYIGEGYSLVREVEDCQCSSKDYECDDYFFKNPSTGLCELISTDPKRPEICDGTYSRPSPFVKRSNSNCTGSGPYSPITMSCKLNNSVSLLESEYKKLIYFVNSTTVLALDAKGVVYVSTNTGRDWVKFDIGSPITDMVHNTYYPERAYLLTAGMDFYYTEDKWSSFKIGKFPKKLNTFDAQMLEFNSDDKDWIIFIGDNDGCPLSDSCHTIAYFTKDGGQKWTEFASYVKDCQWGRDAKFKDIGKSVVYCNMYQNKAGNQKIKLDKEDSFLFMSETFFQQSKQMIDTPINGFAVYENYLIAAVIKEENGKRNLELKSSIDGKTFQTAVFPSEFSVTSGYTILESGFGSVFLNFLISSKFNAEFGHLFISSKEGNVFSLSLKNINRNSNGYVDFEPILGIRGLSILNQVQNINEALYGLPKQVRTLMTFNHGGIWKPINGSGLKCSSLNPNECFLNLHTYTEKSQVLNEISDPGAAGLFIGVGSVGPYLEKYAKSDMYITQDGGFTWRQVRSGPHYFEFADHGGIILMVESEKFVGEVYYSIDYGRTFLTKSLDTPSKITIDKIITEPDSTAFVFILLGHTNEFKYVSVHLDLSNALSRDCKDEDFEEWTLKSGSDNENPECVLGQTFTFKRRKQDSLCRVGELFTTTPKITKTCPCTSYDFECSMGYNRDSLTDECKPISNVAPQEWGSCIDGRQYFGSAYRKVALSECSGGSRLDVTNTVRPCGMESSSKSSSLLIFFSVLVSMIILCGGGYYVYKRKAAGERLVDWTVFSEMANRFRSVRYAPLETEAIEEESDLDVLMDDYP